MGLGWVGRKRHGTSLKRPCLPRILASRRLGLNIHRDTVLRCPSSMTSRGHRMLSSLATRSRITWEPSDSVWMTVRAHRASLEDNDTAWTVIRDHRITNRDLRMSVTLDDTTSMTSREL